ncbi:hypothetical protein ABPG75_004154 [Micractinium tetrahymenae]
MLSTRLAKLPAALQRTPARRPSQPARPVRVQAAWGQLNHILPEDDDCKWTSVFAAAYIPPTNNPASVYDARDALEACNLCASFEERQECLSVFGLDAEQVDTYYSAVYALEQALSHDTDPEEEASHRGQERC